jgi:hypothetical protein
MISAEEPQWDLFAGTTYYTSSKTFILGKGKDASYQAVKAWRIAERVYFTR